MPAVRRGGETSLTCAHFVGLLSPRRPDATRRSSGSSRIESTRPSSVRSFSIIVVAVVVAFSSSLVLAVSRRAWSGVSSLQFRWFTRDDDECAPTIFRGSVSSKRKIERG